MKFVDFKNFENIPVSHFYYSLGAITGLWAGRKIYAAAGYKMGATIAELMNKKNIAEEWNQTGNNYLIQAKKELKDELANISSDVLTGIAIEILQGKVPLKDCPLTIPLAAIVNANIKLASLKSELRNRKNVDLTDQKMIQEEKKIRDDLWTRTNNEIIHDVKKITAVTFLGYLLTGIIEKYYAEKLGMEKTPSLFMYLTAANYLGKKVLFPTGYKIGGMILGLMGHEKAEEWNKASQDYLEQAKKDEIINLFKADLFILLGLQFDKLGYNSDLYLSNERYRALSYVISFFRSILIAGMGSVSTLWLLSKKFESAGIRFVTPETINQINQFNQINLLNQLNQEVIQLQSANIWYNLRNLELGEAIRQLNAVNILLYAIIARSMGII
jgi:hypothetical protein